MNEARNRTETNDVVAPQRREALDAQGARQPAARKHLGLLEKHSDYKKRADDYKKKTARLKTLTRKAAERNQDEFYFAMTKTVAGPRRSCLLYTSPSPRD